MSFDPTSRADRKHVRESLDAWHAWDYRPLADVLGVEATRDAVLAELERLDAVDAAAYEWPENFGREEWWAE